MAERFFEEPFLSMIDEQLIPDDNKTFGLTVSRSHESGELIANIGPSGDAGLDWVIDHNGQFYEIASLGLIPRTVFQKLGLTRQKERLKIENPRSITVGEFQSKIAHIDDQFEEAPSASFTRSILRRYPDEKLVDRTLMEEILGE